MNNVDFGGRYHPLSDRKDNIENKVAICSTFIEIMFKLEKSTVRLCKPKYKDNLFWQIVTLGNLPKWTNGSRRGPGEDKMLIYRYHIRTQNSVESTR